MTDQKLVDMPDSPETINAPYLQTLLEKYTGVADTEVTGFTVQPLEKGTSGARLKEITISHTPDGAPLRFILKIGGGQNEIFFYRDLASRLQVETPRVLDARILGDGRAWLIMEEITDVKDGLAWNKEDYKGVLSDMARLHAQFWSRTELLDDCTWLWRPDEPALQALISARRGDLDTISASWMPQTLPEVFGGDRLALARNVLEEPDKLFGPILAAGVTLVHGDYWFHNVQVTEAGRRVLVDWQDPQIWSGLWELAYFLNLLLVVSPSEYREELPHNEGLMIGWYTEALAEAGVVLPKDVFNQALLAARVWHPLQHWIRQYSYAIAQNLLPDQDILDRFPGATRFLAATFARWEQDARALLG